MMSHKSTETTEVKSKMETGRLDDLFTISFTGEPHSSLVKLDIIEATALAIDLIQYIKEMGPPETDAGKAATAADNARKTERTPPTLS